MRFFAKFCICYLIVTQGKHLLSELIEALTYE